MAITENTYTGDGSTVLFSFTFPYLNVDHVKVALDGSDTTAFTFANATTIQMNSAPSVGVGIRIYRNSDEDNVEATFFPGSSIKSGDLNDNFLQALYLNQETRRIAQEATLGEIADGSINSAKLGTGAVTDVKLASGAVTEAKIGTGAVTEAKLGSAAVTSPKIAASAVGTTQLADDAVTNAKIAADAVNTTEIASSAVTADKLASNAVTTAKINNTAVTVDKLSTGAAGTGVGYVRDSTLSLASGISNGWVILNAPNGSRVLVQWGNATGSSTVALTTVNFHTAFKTATVPIVTATVYGIVFGFSRFVSTSNRTNTAFEYQVRDNSNTAQSHSISWIAIGEAP